MPNYNHLNHCTWDCKYHVVFAPKYRRKALYGLLRKQLKDVLTRLAQQKGCEILEGYLMNDHVHMVISIPPKHSVSNIVGFLKGKSSIWIAQNIGNKQQNFVGHRFWARGYFASTIGLNEDVVRKYVQNQESDDKKQDQLALFYRNK